MTIGKICAARNKMQAVVDAHPEHLQEAFLGCDISHEDSEALKKEYEQKVNPYRQLHIGIVGRVKAGKSSLLNSLFFDGKDVLPKAATPMTAALTKLYYNETLTVKINFFESDDIAELEKASVRYEKLLKEKTSEELNRQIELFKKRNRKEPEGADLAQLKARAEKGALSRLKENNLLLVGEAEQYALYKAAPDSVRCMLGNPVTEYPASILEIREKLADYVGADGKYTGITSNVEIGFPNDALKGITVVDTPGFDDPVPSRDALARDALRVCDAIFVLSPAGSFCNAEDKANIAKIERGEGIQEIFIVASQIDSALRAPECSGKPIPENLASITQSISTSLASMLDGMEHEKLISTELITRLSASTGTSLLYTSGMCQSLYETWDNKDGWDEESRWLFDQMQQWYPDYFSAADETARETLRLIGNVHTIEEKIAEVRSKKDEILKAREQEYLSVKYEALQEAVQSLSDTIQSRRSQIESGDIEELQRAKKKQTECLKNLRASFADAFDSCIDAFATSVRTNLQQVVVDLYSVKKSEMKHAEGTDSRVSHYTVQVPYSVKVKSEEFGSGFARFFGSLVGDNDLGYENVTRYREEDRERNYTVHTVNAHEVASAIRDFAGLVGSTLENNAAQMRMIFKGDLKRSLLDIWAEYELVEYCSNTSRNIQASQIVAQLPEVSFDFTWELPAHLRHSGKLEDDEAYEFEEDAAEALSDLRSTYLKKISDFASLIQRTFQPAQMAEGILQKMSDDIDRLSEQIKSKEQTLYQFDRVQEAVTALKTKIGSIQ